MTEEIKRIFKFRDAEALQLFLGTDDSTLRFVRRHRVRAQVTGRKLVLKGTSPQDLVLASEIVSFISLRAHQGQSTTPQALESYMNNQSRRSTPGSIAPKTEGQGIYLSCLNDNDVVFGLGPAGTGKTFLAVAVAVKALQEGAVKKLVLTRPAVEAGEHLGFLPGTFAEKVDPYLQPLTDSLNKLLGNGVVERFRKEGKIEVAPLAYMRGRAQPLDALVATPTGFVPMGQIQVGDKVLGSNGAPTEVLGVYPQGVRPVYEITFSDGARTRACGEHLWPVWTRYDRRSGGEYRVIPTSEMVGKERTAHYRNFEMPLAAPAQFEARDIPLDPWALGILLGDGGLTGDTPILTSADTFIVEEMGKVAESLGLQVRAKSGSEYDYAISGTRGVTNPITEALRQLEVWGKKAPEKSVPHVYKYNIVDVRLAVLQGLLDSDGGCCLQDGRSPRIQFYTTSETLADDVVFLARSLGGQSWVSQVRVAAHRVKGAKQLGGHNEDLIVVEVKLPEGMSPVRLPRKLNLNPLTTNRRFVDSVVEIGSEEVQCIRVAADDHLYLTDDFIVTHNTLENAYVILDEAQNCTRVQLIMLLTRLGEGSKAVLTGDISQTDLMVGQSGLKSIVEDLQGVEGIGFHEFGACDVVRHPLVARIIEALANKGSVNPVL